MRLKIGKIFKEGRKQCLLAVPMPADAMDYFLMMLSYANVIHVVRMGKLGLSAFTQ